jgi:hypothetical protein
MAAISPIVMNDGQTTPVAHTFAPAKTVADFALLEDRAAGIYIGYNKLTMSLTRPTGKPGSSRNLKLSMKIETPKLETIGTASNGLTPPPLVAYRPVVELLFTLPERCSMQDRKDLAAYVKALVLNANFTAAVEQYELPY